MARKTWQTKADWQAGIAENLEITDAGVKLARPEPAQFIRASEAYKSDGTLIPSGAPRYEGAGVRVEPGTTNLIPLANQKFEGWTAYQGATVTLTQNQTVPEWSATDATRIQTSGGTNTQKYVLTFGSASVNATTYTMSAYVKNVGAVAVKFINGIGGTITIQPGEMGRFSVTGIGNGTTWHIFAFYALNAADNLDFIAWRPQAEAKTLATTWTDGTRAPETISVPVPFTPQGGGSLSFKVDVTPQSKRQVAGEYPHLLALSRANGGTGLFVAHSEVVAQFTLRTLNDAGEFTQAGFADSLIPNGTRELTIEQTIPAVILYCDGQPIARIDNPKLPSGWGRAYLGSSATGANQANTTFGNLRMVVG